MWRTENGLPVLTIYIYHYIKAKQKNKMGDKLFLLSNEILQA